jgi:HTH-type transcriptional regulator/antitoxin HigA
MNERIPIEVFPPGDFIREELEERGWTQEVLSDVLGTSLRLVNEIITGKRAISPETARGLGEAFDTGAQVWMNLEGAYRLSLVRARGDAIARRARLYSKAPVKEMLKRHWIEPSDSIEVLEERVLKFLGIRNLDEELAAVPHAARKSTPYNTVTAAQCVWLLRARALAKAVHAEPYTETRFRNGLVKLRGLLHSIEEIRHVPRVLADAGVRLLIVEPLAQTRIDGAAFWLDAKSPVLVLSLRYDRVDGFWYTLFHDLMHILNKDVKYDDPPIVDSDLVGERSIPTTEKPAIEQRADKDAAEALVPKAKLDDFIARIGPLYSKRSIVGFATVIGVHPGIVVGQLHHRDEIPYSHNREMLEKVREIVCGAALTDGWGHMPQFKD